MAIALTLQLSINLHRLIVSSRLCKQRILQVTGFVRPLTRVVNIFKN